MSMQENVKSARKIERRLRRPARPHPMDASSIAAYVHEVAHGVRELTRLQKQRDLKFLDYLLAMAEAEAASLSSQTFH